MLGDFSYADFNPLDSGKGLSFRCHEHIPQVRQDHEAGDEDNDPQHGAGRQDEGFLQCHQPSSEMGSHGHCRGEDLSGCGLLPPCFIPPSAVGSG